MGTLLVAQRIFTAFAVSILSVVSAQSTWAPSSLHRGSSLPLQSAFCQWYQRRVHGHPPRCTEDLHCLCSQHSVRAISAEYMGTLLVAQRIFTAFAVSILSELS